MDVQGRRNDGLSLRKDSTAFGRYGDSHASVGGRVEHRVADHWKDGSLRSGAMRDSRPIMSWTSPSRPTAQGPTSATAPAPNTTRLSLSKRAPYETQLADEGSSDL